MRVTDIVSALHLDIYASISLVLFLAVFVSVAWRVATMSKRQVHEAAGLPLDDSPVPTQARKEARGG
ncbi:MAG: hypothetical protein R3B49_09930 [Phycisphaerales bacterium]